MKGIWFDHHKCSSEQASMKGEPWWKSFVNLHQPFFQLDLLVKKPQTGSKSSDNNKLNDDCFLGSNATTAQWACCNGRCWGDLNVIRDDFRVVGHVRRDKKLFGLKNGWFLWQKWVLRA